MTIPTYMRPLVQAVLKHADTIGDGHAGWAAIHDHWEPFAIACTLARAKVREPHHAVVEMQRVADEIITNLPKPSQKRD